MEGQFPNWAPVVPVIPDKQRLAAQFEGADMLAAIRQVADTAREEGYKVALQPNGQAITLMATAPGIAKAQATCAATLGDLKPFYLNAKYLADPLNAYAPGEGGTWRLYGPTEKGALVLEAGPQGEYCYQHVMMMIRDSEDALETDAVAAPEPEPQPPEHAPVEASLEPEEDDPGLLEAPPEPESESVPEAQAQDQDQTQRGKADPLTMYAQVACAGPPLVPEPAPGIVRQVGNIIAHLEGDALILYVKVQDTLTRSRSGKNDIKATTHGPLKLGNLRVGLNVWEPVA